MKESSELALHLFANGQRPGRGCQRVYGRRTAKWMMVGHIHGYRWIRPAGDDDSHSSWRSGWQQSSNAMPVGTVMYAPVFVEPVDQQHEVFVTVSAFLGGIR